MRSPLALVVSALRALALPRPVLPGPSMWQIETNARQVARSLGGD
jgi:hypothetical protein